MAGTPFQYPPGYGPPPGGTPFQRPSAQPSGGTPFQYPQGAGPSVIGARGEEAVEGFEDIDPALLGMENYQGALRQLQNLRPENRLKVLKKLKRSAQDIRSLRKGAVKTAVASHQIDRPDLARRVLEASRRQPEPKTGVWETAAKPEGFFDALDTAGKFSRQEIARQAIPGHKPYEKKLDQGTFWKQMKAEADKPGPQLADLLVRPAQVAGAIPGVLGGGLAGLAGGVSDLMTGRTQGMGQRMKEAAFDEGPESGAELALAIGTDPLSFVGGGAGVGAKGASSAAARAGARAGLAPAQVQTLKKGIASAVGANVNMAKRSQNARRVFKKFGIEGEFEKTFGKAGEFLESGGLGIGMGDIPIPFTGKSIPTTLKASQVTGSEHGIKRGIQALDQRLLGDRAARRVTALSRAELRVAGRGAKEAGRSQKAAGAMRTRELVEQLGKVAESAPAGMTAARREEIVMRVLDPFFYQKSLGEVGGVAVSGPRRAPIAPRQMSLKPEEVAWVDGIKAWLGANQKDLIANGIIKAGTKNPISGIYYPRGYSPSKLGTAEDALDFTAKRQRADGWGIPSGALDEGLDYRKAIDEGADFMPVDRVDLDMKAKLDPYDVLPALAKGGSDKIAYQNTKNAIIEQFGKTIDDFPGIPRLDVVAQNPHWTIEGGRAVPKKILEMVDKDFDTTFNTMADAVRKLPGGHHMAKPLQVAEWLRNRFKRNVLLKVPGYHVLNAYNDTLQMMSGGVRNPLGKLLKARKVLDGAGSVRTPTGTLTGSQVRDLANANNIGLHSIERLDLIGGGRPGTALKMKHAKAAGQRFGKGEGARARFEGGLRKVDVLGRGGEKVAGFWDDASKTAMFIDGLERGLSPKAAAKRAFDFLLDYTDRNKATQVMRWFMPFGTWAAKAPMMTARAAYRRPGNLSAVNRAFDAFTGGEERGYEPSRYVTQMGPTKALGPQGRQTLRGLIEGQPGLNADVDPGYGFSIRPRDPFSEAAHPGLSMLGGLAKGELRSGLDPAIQMLAPGLRAAAEQISERDLFTGKPISQVLGQQGMGMGKGVGAAMRYLAPSFIDPLTAHAAQEAYGAIDPTGPMNVVGYSKPYSDDRDTYNAIRRLVLLSRLGIHQTDPSGAVRNQAQAPEARSLRDLVKEFRAAQKAAKGR